LQPAGTLAFVIDGRAELIARIDAELPQTQCTRCGFPTCLDYASALADQSTAINRCPPGGAATVRALSQLLTRPELPLDPDCGSEAPWRVALIDEAVCIGCTKCIQACPVDAIIGAAKLMHTVLKDPCTGCELCIAPCPVDCITMVEGPPRSTLAQPARLRPEVHVARTHFETRKQRIAREEQDKALRVAARQREQERAQAKAMLQAALERARAKSEKR